VDSDKVLDVHATEIWGQPLALHLGAGCLWTTTNLPILLDDITWFAELFWGLKMISVKTLAHRRHSINSLSFLKLLLFVHKGPFQL
jgi:hypothetical protein